MTQAWISVNDALPELYQPVAFVVKSREHYYNGRVLGGTYQGNKYGTPECACPGISFEITHWMPLPEPPKADNIA